MLDTRPPAVAGTFYAADETTLRNNVIGLLESVDVTSGNRPQALISPHAGYMYSGQVAARAYARLRPWSDEITRVVILGPPHYLPLRGLSASSMGAFETPLGVIPVDTSEIKRTLDFPQITANDRAHEPEHSIEVQLPFLQAVLNEFSIVPLIVGESTPSEVSGVIEKWWNDDKTLILVSTDLSHFLDYDIAKTTDSRTDEYIRRFDHGCIGPEQACGYASLNGVLHLARERKAKIERLMLCNSGDTAGPRDHVVGYASYAIS